MRFRSLLTELPGERVVILSTHIVSDVEATATHIALIANGLLLAHSTPERLVATAEGQVWEGVVPTAALNVLRQRYVICGTIRRGDEVHVRLLSPHAPAELGADARRATATLEDAYLVAMASARAHSGAAA